MEASVLLSVSLRTTVLYVCSFLHVDLPTAVETGKLNLFLPVALSEVGASVLPGHVLRY